MSLQRTPPSTPLNTTTQNNDSHEQSTSGVNMSQEPLTEPQTGGEVHRVSIKPIQFIKTAPKLYFMQMESQFHLAGITRDNTKYHHILGSLDPIYLASVVDIMENPPAVDKYETIKNRIIAEFQQSDQHKLRILLREIALGDLKPSQLLRKMRDLSNNALSDDILKTLWIERLPEQIRPVISISDGDLNKIAQMADKMLEITAYSYVSEVAAPIQYTQNDNSIDGLIRQVGELTKRVDKLSNNRGRSRNRSRSQDRNRSTSRKKDDSPYCYYHFKFGAMARKCNEPCKFKTESDTKSTQAKN